MRGGHKPYPPGSFDLLAAYVVEGECWYIIPEGKILGRSSVSLYLDSKKAKYESYREAWNLLEESQGGGDKIEIQACTEGGFELLQ